MPIRLTEWLGLAFGAAVGGSLTPAVLGGDPSKLLSTFLGLVSASILPTVSLIIASMTSGGRSVMTLDALQRELQSAMDALFILLTGVGVVFAAVFALSVPPPLLLTHLPFLTYQLLPRLGQAIVVSGSTFIVMRAWHVPAILRNVLRVRHEIAVEEARKRIVANATNAGTGEELFPRDPEFGKTAKLSELRSE